MVHFDYSTKELICKELFFISFISSDKKFDNTLFIFWVEGEKIIFVVGGFIE